MATPSRSWYGRRADIGQADGHAWRGHEVQILPPDEKIESFELDYDGKRDRWNEYITALFAQKLERYEVRKKYLKEQLLKKLQQKNNSDSDDVDNDDGHSKEGLASVVLQETSLPKRKYEEDVYINNHTAVWGSWHKDHQWGYKCCKQFVRNSYCTSAAGIEAPEAAADLIKADIAHKEASEDEEKQKQPMT